MIDRKHVTSRIAALALTLVAIPCIAADFRVLDFDAPCDNLTALETARGSTAFEGRLPSGFQFAFHTRMLDRDAIVGYACRNGHFFRGAYIFNARDGQEATEIYTALKQQATKERGAPSYDFASKEYRQKMHAVGAALALSDTQVAFWNGKTSEAHASVAEPSGSRGWQVSLSYTVNSAL
jgi:hypothetical protein